jgi:excisionase family DNA binding protein
MTPTLLKPKLTNPHRMLTTREVALVLNVTPRTVCLWAECNEIPAIRVGRQWRFRSYDLTKWLITRNVGCAPIFFGSAASS